MGKRRIVGVVPVAVLLLGGGVFSSCGSAQIGSDGTGGHAGAAGSGGRANGGNSGAAGTAGGAAVGGAAGQTASAGAAGSATGGAGGSAGVSASGGAGGRGMAGAGGARGGAAGTGSGGSSPGGSAGTNAGGASGGTAGRAGAAGAAGSGAAGAGGGAGAPGAGGVGPGGSGGAAGSTGMGGYNLVFVTSRTDLKPNLGSAAAYDTVCNQLATAAGINDTSGNAFVALVGDAQSSPVTRLGNARGFVRTDGAPVADDLASLFSANRLLNPIRADEHGVIRPGVEVLTGLAYDGSVDPASNCAGWTSTSASASITGGSSNSGPPVWYYWETGTCDGVAATGAVYCFMKTRTSPLVVTPVAGKKIFLTNGPIAVGADADARCAASKPPGTGTVSALRATTTAPASSLLTMTAKYVRPDGILVGLGSDLVAAAGTSGQTLLASGIWQQGDGTYVPTRAVWTGATSLTTTGTVDSTCSNWTSTASTSVITGATPGTDPGFWQNAVPWRCDNTYTWSYCVER